MYNVTIPPNTSTKARISLWTITLSGLVQGVGFRPFVWREAKKYRIDGCVLNDGHGVVIHAQCTDNDLSEFLYALETKCPTLARIDDVSIQPMEPTALSTHHFADGFEIIASDKGTVTTSIVPDAATCPDCLNDIKSKKNRRHNYAFTNCTNCGPRFSIIRSLPYDRQATSMVDFTQCPSCQEEYDSPTDRRFHAQPNACHECGPTLWLEDAHGEKLSRSAEHVLKAAQSMLCDGKIIALKGIGGFHLACDATNEDAIIRLRARKRRPGKPFALMAKNIGMIETYAHLSDDEKAILESPAAPVTLLKSKAETLPEVIAPGYSILGFMLPYSGLHHLLFEGLDRPLVMTSANQSHAPQICDNDEAREALADIADAFIMHDRTIENRIDDSVVHALNGRMKMVRRARGYAPDTLILPDGFDLDLKCLSMGADLKNSFCLAGNGQAILSQHMGDQDNIKAHQDYQRNIALYQDLFEFTPDVISHDLHPDFQTSKWARQRATDTSIPLHPVQHHHAHMAAVMGEHGLIKDHGPVLGVILDGFGLGQDGGVWGGEFLWGNYKSCERLVHFPLAPLIGGDKAAKMPWRNLYAHLSCALDWQMISESYGDLQCIKALKAQNLALCDQMMEKGINSPLSSSAGRLFDAVAAALGICFDGITYEGEAAILLEELAHSDQNPDHAVKPYAQHNLQNWTPLFEGVITDLANAVERSLIARKFHVTLAHLIITIIKDLKSPEICESVVLGGGVFQNRMLSKLVETGLRREGYRCLTPERLPAHDGGLALGQALITLARDNPG